MTTKTNEGFIADVMCGPCGNLWSACVPPQDELVNPASITFECPVCHKDTGAVLSWRVSDVPAKMLRRENEE